MRAPPGAGKSTLAQCFLNACGRKTFLCRKDKPNGDFVQEIVRIFDEAASAAPSVVLLDDLDKYANEAGHALIAELLELDSVDLVSVLSHNSNDAGVTSVHRSESYFHSKRLMEIRVMCLRE